MAELLSIMISFPTVIFTVFIGVVILYWGMVIVGAFDIDILDFGGADGAMDGSLEGAAEGAVEAAVEGATEGAVEAAVEGATEGAAEAAVEGATEGAAEGAAEGASETITPSGFAGVLTALRLRHAPVTVVFSLISIYCWVVCMVMMRVLLPRFDTIVPVWLLGTVVLAVALVISIPLTSISSRPLKQFFIIHSAPRRQSLIGKICTVTTGRVDEKFGQAEIQDGGAGLLIQVRCDTENELKRNSEALIVSYDTQREAFIVEAYDRLLSGKSR